jgi:hypothetical protein
MAFLILIFLLNVCWLAREQRASGGQVLPTRCMGFKEIA